MNHEHPAAFPVNLIDRIVSATDAKIILDRGQARRGFPFSINSAVDHMLKKEFDIHHANNTKHPLIKKYGVDATPVAHDMLDTWRENFKGIEYLHTSTNLTITGAIDDLWQNSQGEYIVVVKQCLLSDQIPDAKDGCDYCAYVGAVQLMSKKKRK